MLRGPQFVIAETRLVHQWYAPNRSNQLLMDVTAHPHSCPRDGGILHAIEHKKIPTMQCGTCGGLWIPKAQMVGRIHANLIGKLYHVPATKITNLCCPVDGSALRELFANGVLLDRCLACGGLWFDRGELETVLGNVHYTTVRKLALTGADTASGADTLLSAVSALAPSRTELAVEAVFEVIAEIASSIIP